VISLRPIDRFGHEFSIGDRVRLVQLLTNIAALPRTMQRLFHEALGRTFKVETFGKCGHAELHLSKKVVMLKTSMWVEPQCLELSLHGGKKSGTFGPNLHIANT